MFSRIIISSFKADIKFIVRDPMLLMASIAPLFLILLLRLGFPVLSDFIFQKFEFQIYQYYSIASITMVSLIPMLFGMVYAFIVLDESDAHILQVISVTPAGRNNFLYMRMIVPAFLSFLMVLITILFTNPMPSEGWLRTLYVSLLLASQVPFVFLFIGSLARNKVEGLALSKFYGVFLVTVPLGLLLHQPWNYLNFFSPLYWISWAWVTEDPTESLLYGGIAVIITAVCVVWLFQHFLKKQVS